MNNITTILSPKFIVPIEPANKFLVEHSIALDEQGRIADILPTKDAKQKYAAVSHVELKEQVVMPGLVNAHTHSPMTLLRGIADDLPLMEWLSQHIWPAENKWLGDEFIHDGMQLAFCEMLKSGTTCFQENYLFPPAIAQVTKQAKMRALIGVFMIKFPTAWNRNVADAVAKSEFLFAEYQQDPLVKINLAPHAPYSLDDKDLQEVTRLAKKHSCSIHMHVHESVDEINGSLKEFKLRPLQRLEKFGLLDFPFSAVHMTQLDDSDFALLQKHSAVSVIHCPESNLKIANGFCPTAQLLEQGINVALGTDGAASNNDLDMFGELRTAALIAKGISQNPTAMPAASALNMATINGAKALGLEKEIGSITVGKAADLISVDLSNPNTQPIYNPISHLVYAVNNRQVTNVWVAGQRLLQDGKLTTIDEAAVLAKAKEWGQKIITN